MLFLLSVINGLTENWNLENINYYLKDEWEYIDGIPTPKNKN